MKGYARLWMVLLFFGCGEVHAAGYDPLAVDPKFKARALELTVQDG
jgi:hypothetical protein